jgi:hypothetical protein
MASPTLIRTRNEPAPVAATRHHRARTQVRAQWLVLAAALTVLAGVLVAWSIDRAADRVDVISVARPVAAGTVIGIDDLTTTAIAFDTPVTGLVPSSSIEALVGRVATIDLQPGALLASGMWADGTELTSGERTVGALLDAGRYPGGLAQGATALAVATIGSDDAACTTSVVVDGCQALVRVLEVARDDRGSLRVTLAVPEADAAHIARLAAADSLVLVGVPTQRVTPTDVAQGTAAPLEGTAP